MFYKYGRISNLVVNSYRIQLQKQIKQINQQFSKSKMNRPQTKYFLCFGSFFTKLVENPDAIDQDLIERKNYNFSTDEEELTGFDRVKNIFKYDKYGLPSPELSLLYEGTAMSLFTGVILGGASGMLNAYIDFMKNNQATQFESIFHAKKTLQDRVMMSFIRRGAGYGFKLSIFTSSMILFTSCISAYRGHSSIVEYTGAGALAGAIFKIKESPRAGIVGGIIGGALGTFAGLCTIGILKLGGTTIDDLKTQQKQIMRQHMETEKLKIRELRDPTFAKFTKDDLDIDLATSLNDEVEENLKLKGKLKDEKKEVKVS